MPKYRNTSDQRVWVRKACVVVEPGEVFESAVPLNNDAFEEVKDKKPGAAPAKE